VTWRLPVRRFYLYDGDDEDEDKDKDKDKDNAGNSFGIHG
jgi:hypothetical protein